MLIELSSDSIAMHQVEYALSAFLGPPLGKKLFPVGRVAPKKGQSGGLEIFFFILVFQFLLTRA